MKKIGLLILLSVIVYALFNCGGRREERLTEDQLDSLQATYYALNDSLENAWQVMIEDDDKKLAYLRRLMEEISATNNYDEEVYESYMKMVDALASMRYTQEMMDSDVIDEYDSATNAVIGKITSYAYDHPDFDNYPLMNELVSDINQAQSMVLIYRSRYDIIAKNLNEFIEENEHRLIDRDNTKVQFKKKPLFEYPNEVGDPYELGDTLDM